MHSFFYVLGWLVGDLLCCLGDVSKRPLTEFGGLRWLCVLAFVLITFLSIQVQGVRSDDSVVDFSLIDLNTLNSLVELSLLIIFVIVAGLFHGLLDRLLLLILLLLLFLILLLLSIDFLAIILRFLFRLFIFLIPSPLINLCLTQIGLPRHSLISLLTPSRILFKLLHQVPHSIGVLAVPLLSLVEVHAVELVLLLQEEVMEVVWIKLR